MQQHTASPRRFGFTAGLGWNWKAFGDFYKEPKSPGQMRTAQVSIQTLWEYFGLDIYGATGKTSHRTDPLAPLNALRLSCCS